MVAAREYDAAAAGRGGAVRRIAWRGKAADRGDREVALNGGGRGKTIQRKEAKKQRYTKAICKGLYSRRALVVLAENA